MGVNFLGVTGRVAFPLLGEMEQRGLVIDAYWADDARIEERTENAFEAQEIAAVRSDSEWTGLYFGGTAFKKQRLVDPIHYVLGGRGSLSLDGCGHDIRFCDRPDRGSQKDR
ncbi:MAG: hypothetical protein Ct9H300mP16_03300 [Pseudomonadota bacterium]|nr:MAG: hypothetical protein Ct9H300mP16_03300 [Pseudomonadota bacterium]